MMEPPSWDEITDQEKLKVCASTVGLMTGLARAFDTPDVSPRNRYIFALRAISEFLGENQAPTEWRRKIFQLQMALGELDQGIVPALLQAAKRSGGGRPDNEWRVWWVRSCAVLAWDARTRAGMPPLDRVKEIKKRHPKLSEAPFVTGRKAQLRTSIENWERRLNETKTRAHLSLVAELWWDAKLILDAESPERAITAADALLQNALH